MKLVLAAAMCFALWIASVVTRRPKLVLLFAWVVALTYNRQYFSFEAVAGNNGAQGPYWIVSDFFLLPLVGIWAYEATIRKRVQQPQSPAVYPLFLPFAFVGALSALGADRPDWSLYELVRAAKMVLILCYVRYNFTAEAWWTCAVAMTCAAVLQAGLGTAEVVTGRSGVLGVLGLGGMPDDMPEEFSQERFYGWHRATATMNHPPNLACYLLLTVPLALGVALAPSPRRIRTAAGLASLIGLVGLACTLSRWPWVLAIGQATFLLFALTWLGVLPVKQTLGLLSIGALAGTIAILPFSGFIADRINRDLDRSLEFRDSENRVALAMFAEHPLVGVGLNNYSLHLAAHDSEMAWALDNPDLAVKKLRVRFIAAPQNGFLLPLAETGIGGLAAFLFYLAGASVIGIRAIARSGGWARAAVLGQVTGMLGVIAQQIIDYSFWVDPVFYTFTLIVGMLACAPALNARSDMEAGRPFQGRHRGPERPALPVLEADA